MIPARSQLEANPPASFSSMLALREGNRKKPIYEIHKWWARRQGTVFRNIIIGAVTPASRSVPHPSGRFYEKQDLSGLVVLDPFVGGGTSVVEAAKCHANVIGIDIDPVACLVTSLELEPIDEKSLQRSFREDVRSSRDRILKWYRTTLPDGREGTIIYAFWVDILKCSLCKSKHAAHPHYQLCREPSRKKQTVFCAKCGEVAQLPLSRSNFRCPSCRGVTRVKRGVVDSGVLTCPDCKGRTRLSDSMPWSRPPRQVVFALEVVPDGSDERVYKKADAEDLALFERAKRARATLERQGQLLVPNDSIPRGRRADPRPVSYGYTKYSDLFNARQQLCLSILGSAISKLSDKRARNFLALAFSDALAANNMLCFYAFDYRKLTPLFGLHAYYKAQRPVENNVWGVLVGRGSFLKCYQKLLRGKRYGRWPFEYLYRNRHDDHPKRVHTGEAIRPIFRDRLPTVKPNGNNYAVVMNQSSESMSTISAGAVDLILSDPPYYDNLAYSELADFYHVWLKKLKLARYEGNQRANTPLSSTLYVRKDSKKLDAEHRQFSGGLAKVFNECHRVLKRSGMLVFTFHHNDPRAWTALAAALASADFAVTNVFPVRSEGQSRFHSSDGNLKWDAVFCCRKRLSNKNPRSVRRLGATALRRSAELWIQEWRRKLRSAGLRISSADARSLGMAQAVKLLCNSRTRPEAEILDAILRMERQTKNAA